MEQVSVPRVGRPLKYPGGWGSANKSIYLSESVYQGWLVVLGTPGVVDGYLIRL